MKHLEAALYRHAWKRAVVLGDIAAAAKATDDVETYRQFQEFAANNYSTVAPSGPYGKIRLKMSGKARGKLYEAELSRITAERERSANTILRRFSGAVYLVKYGLDYKIGMTNSVSRRYKEIKLLLPEKPTIIHSIKTNNPRKVERYWHRRFVHKKNRGEWYRLNDLDVEEFCGRDSM